MIASDLKRSAKMKKLDSIALKSARWLIHCNSGYFHFAFSIISAILWFLFYLYDGASWFGFTAIISLSSAVFSFNVRGFELLLKEKTEPNHALVPTTTAVTDCAAHTPRQL
jgi:hypothetical protein